MTVYITGGGLLRLNKKAQNNLDKLQEIIDSMEVGDHTFDGIYITKRGLEVSTEHREADEFLDEDIVEFLSKLVPYVYQGATLEYHDNQGSYWRYAYRYDHWYKQPGVIRYAGTKEIFVI